tara:strand:+ start:2391 stop:2672 length:282 start_codon:yes stop_codon:yes gene_type:complete
MKVEKAKLIQIIKEELQEAYVASLAPKSSGEGKMAKSQLLRTAEYSAKLIEMLEDDEDLEAWVQSKITLASDYLAKVYHYMHGEDVLQENLKK